MSGARDCKRCGQVVRVVKSGHMRAHKCTHGIWCTAPYNERRHGAVATCPQCFADRQQPIFGEQLTLQTRR